MTLDREKRILGHLNPNHTFSSIETKLHERYISFDSWNSYIIEWHQHYQNQLTKAIEFVMHRKNSDEQRTNNLL